MSADDDDRMIDQPFDEPGRIPDLKERCRRAIAFLQRARELPELSSAQIDRIERRLQQPRSVRRPLLSPALAAIVVLLLAGGAVAMVGRDLTWLPGIGRWLGPRHEPSPAPAPRAGSHRLRVEPLGAAPLAVAPQAVTTAPLSSLPAPTNVPPAAAEPVAPAIDRAAGAAEPSRPRETRVALAPMHHALPGGEAAETRIVAPVHSGEPELTPGSVPAEPAFAPAPPASPRPTSPAPMLAPPPTVAATAERPTAPALPSTAPPSPIVAESRSFASALELWHRDHDAAAALSALDAHERRFPAGQILLEARLLRTEILLAGGRDADALALLDPLALAGLPRARELRTVRGELRIKLGRCADGKADLQVVLAAGTADPLAQRARKAIASCP